LVIGLLVFAHVLADAGDLASLRPADFSTMQLAQPAPLPRPGESARETPRPPPPRPTVYPLFHYPPIEFLEKNYIFNSLPWPGPPGKRVPLIFEAWIAPHFFFYENLGRRLDSGEPGFAFSLPFTFGQQLRMLATQSSPIRMPSYMPRVQLQAFYVVPPKEQDRLLRLVLGKRPSFDLFNISFGVNHLSNGQEGCRYFDQAGNCLPRPVSRDDPDLSAELNRTSADFSANYLTLEFNWRHGVLDDVGFVSRSMRYGLRFLYAPQHFGPGSADEEVYLLWGPTRVRGLVQYVEGFPYGQLNTELGLELIGGTGKNVAPYRVWLECAWTLREHSGVGIFARWYSGQDYYNAFFVDTIHVLQFGLVIDQAPPLRFAR
jgi:hypothetical protein